MSASDDTSREITPADGPTVEVVGIDEVAAFWAVRSTPVMASLRVMMSEKVSRPSRL